MSGIVERVAELAVSAAEAEGCELVDAEYLKEGGDWILRVYVDRAEGGVGLAHCAAVSDRLEGLLDVHDPISTPYRLEVSSPGLTRPLKKKEHFHQFAGKLAVIKTFRPLVLEGAGKEMARKRFSGMLEGMEEDKVLLREGEALWRIPFDLISKANLDFDPRENDR
ncbi:MAG: ribosome maturation factor RimP [Magnetococcales bacterium]|nr:ribosome maturation factor RimP [Magnetococcales bacterium]